MNEFLKFIGGLVVLSVTLTYFLAALYAPFGIVYLVFFKWVVNNNLYYQEWR